MAREQKKDTEQVYDKNAFATIDRKKTLYHMYCTVLKNIEKMSSLDVFTQNPNTLFLIWNKIDGQPEKEFIPHLSIYTVATCSATAAERESNL